MADETKNTASQSTAIKRHILTILEPTIKPDQIIFDAAGEDKGGVKQSRENGSWAPSVHINKHKIDPTDITDFKLSVSGFIPTMSLTFDDTTHMFHGDSIPRDGDVMNLRISARQEDSFKDIRADFLITSVRASKEEPLFGGDLKQNYNMTGVLKVPGLKVEECVSYAKASTIDHLKEIATKLKLGYASNIDKTDDAMTRLCPYISRMDFIQSLIDHSYVDKTSFQIGFIDPYYYLNFIDLNKSFNSPNEFEETLIHLMQTDYQLFDKDKEELEKINKLKAQMALSNHSNFGGTSQEITNFKLINESGGISLAQGSSRKLQFFEMDSDEKLVTFDLMPSATDKEKMQDHEEPLKGRRGEQDYKAEVRQKYVGRIDVDPAHGNMNINYYHASMLNSINRAEIYKMGLEVTTSTVNTGLYRGMKIPVLLFSKTTNEHIINKGTKDAMEKKGFKTLGKQLINEDLDKEDPIVDKETLDEFTSGFYIIDSIEYIYETGTGSENTFYQKMRLLRREWPTKIHDINKETLEADAAPAPAPEPTPVPPPPPPAPEPVAETPAVAPEPTPLAEPTFTLDIKDLKQSGEFGLGSWFDLDGKLMWKADDKTLVTETPKIKLVFSGPSDYSVDAVVMMEDKSEGQAWNKITWNTEFTVPKNTFKDKEGKYVVDVILTYKEQTVKETLKYEFRPWKAGTVFDRGGFRAGKVQYTWKTVSGQEAPSYIGSYTLKTDANKNGDAPMNGKIEGTDLNDVIKRTQEAAQAEGTNN